MAENLFIGSHRSSNYRWDVGYIRTFYELVYEVDLAKCEDFSKVLGEMSDMGFDVQAPIDMGIDGDVLVYGQAR